MCTQATVCVYFVLLITSEYLAIEGLHSMTFFQFPLFKYYFAIFIVNSSAGNPVLIL